MNFPKSYFDLNKTKQKPKRKITRKSAKAKGRALQKWTAEKISYLLDIKTGKDELIESREMGQPGVDIKLYGDAAKRFPFSIECKNQEKWSIQTWIDQAKFNKKRGTDWLLIAKKNQSDAVVIMDAARWFAREKGGKC